MKRSFRRYWGRKLFRAFNYARHNFRLQECAVAGALIVSIFTVWYEQDERVIERTVAENYGRALQIVAKHPANINNHDFELVKQMYEPETAELVDSRIEKIRDLAENTELSEDEEYRLHRKEVVTQRHADGYKISLVTMKSNDSADVVVCNSGDTVIATVPVVKVDGEWKFEKMLFLD